MNHDDNDEACIENSPRSPLVDVGKASPTSGNLSIGGLLPNRTKYS